jgi:hypothetical protein
VIDQLLVLGASGDLAGRYLLPALAHLHQADRLPEPLAIVGVARDDWDTATFRRHVADRLERHAATVDPAARDALVAMASYQWADAGDAAALAGALDQAKGPVVAYLALPPAAFAPAIGALAAVGLPEGSRVVVEKPFGRSLAEAQALNQLLARCFGEEATFRADHFLSLQTVQNLLGLRFANRVFEPVWNAGHVERVEVVWDETVALEGRAGYYDHAGALRDMIQNHLLQLVCLTAMEPPSRLDPDRLHDRKVELLRAVQPPPPGQLAARTVRARYSAGRVDGVDVPAYVDEPGVDQCDRRDQQHRGRGRGGVAGRQGREPGHGGRVGGRHHRRGGAVRAPSAVPAAASRVPGSAATGPGIIGLVVEVHPEGEQHDEDRRSDPVDDQAERRPPASIGHKLPSVLPQVLGPMADEAGHQQPGRSGDTRGGNHHEGGGDHGLDGDDPRPSVRDREPDVDRRDQGYRQGIDGGRVQPPEAERGRGLDDAPDDAPQHGCPQRPPRQWVGR